MIEIWDIWEWWNTLWDISGTDFENFVYEKNTFKVLVEADKRSKYN